MPGQPHDISYFGVTDFRASGIPFGIHQADRQTHNNKNGKTSKKKTNQQAKQDQQDIEAGRGFALIDPHGDLAEQLWRQTPTWARARLLYLNGPEPEQPLGYNPLRRVREDHIPLAASGLLETLRKLWPAAWGERKEHVLRNSINAL